MTKSTVYVSNRKAEIHSIQWFILPLMQVRDKDLRVLRINKLCNVQCRAAIDERWNTKKQTSKKGDQEKWNTTQKKVGKGVKLQKKWAQWFNSCVFATWLNLNFVYEVTKLEETTFKISHETFGMYIQMLEHEKEYVVDRLSGCRRRWGRDTWTTRTLGKRWKCWTDALVSCWSYSRTQTPRPYPFPISI